MNFLNLVINKITDSGRIMRAMNRSEICEVLDAIARDVLAGNASASHANVLLSIRFALLTPLERKREEETLEYINIQEAI